MKPSKVTLDFKGLVTAPGRLTNPPGALVTAENVDFPAPGLCVKRKGITSKNELGGAVWSMLTNPWLYSDLILSVGNNIGGTSLQYTNGVGAPVALPTPDSNNIVTSPTWRLYQASTMRNLYIANLTAPVRIESDLNRGASYAGMPRPFDFYKEANNPLTAVAGGFLANGFGCAYRVVWLCEDAEGVQRMSAPSGRYSVYNIAATPGFIAATAANVNLYFQVPYQANTRTTAPDASLIGGAQDPKWQYLVFRSKQTNVGAGAFPNDEMQLIYQGTLSAAQIGAGFVTFQDTCPDAMQGEYLYTNAISGGDVSSSVVRAPEGMSLGLGASNDRPPLAKTVAGFADCVFYANYFTLYRLSVSCLGVGAAGTVLQVGDTVTVSDGVTTIILTGVAGPTAVVGQFEVTLGFGSVTINTQMTMQNLVAAINRHPTNTKWVATYLGNNGQAGTVGQIQIENRVISTSEAPPSITSSRGTAFSPDVTNALVASRDERVNGIAISKPNQGDAVPPLNYVSCGSETANIWRMAQVRDVLFIFKEDGIWWLRNQTPADFVLEPFDATFRLQSPNMLTVCDDAVYAWGLEGIARITTGGVEYIDTPIRNFVLNIERGLSGAVFQGTDAFAVSYPTKRRVLFFFRTGAETGTADYGCAQALVYNIDTQSWATYNFDTITSGKENSKLCGVVRFSDELLHLGLWSPGTDTLLQAERNTNTSADYQDVLNDGTDTPLVADVRWAAMTSTPDTLTRWIECIVHFASSLVSPAPTTPAALTFTFTTDIGGGSVAWTQPTSATMARVIVDQRAGYGARMIVRLRHTAAEILELNALSLRYDIAGPSMTR